MEAHKNSLLAYLKHHNYELTDERQIMLRVIGQMDEFSWPAFRRECERQDVSMGTVYNFRKLLIDAGILLPEVVIPMRFSEAMIDFNGVQPKKEVKAGTRGNVKLRVENSYRDPKYL